MANSFFVGAPPMGPMALQSGPVGPMIGHHPPPPPPFIDPAMNNLPLNFKGKLRPPNDEDIETEMTVSSNQPMLPPMMGPGGMMMPPWNPMMNPMGMGDPMMMWGAWGPMGPIGMGPEPLLPQAQHEVINLKGAILYPPPPNSKPPTYRERPPGCRTIFVGGLPETVTEEILREMFETCGNIVSLRHSKKNFAHIRFEMHDSVERALYYSGYRMKVDDKEDKPNTGRIHVDYAQARDDLFEHECYQRSLERESRHRERMEEEMNRPPSPPKVIQYSDHEALVLVDSLKGDETFVHGTHTLLTWLDRGDCNRRTSSTFYSLLQSTNVHVRRLMNEKLQYTNELEQMKLRFRQRFEALINQLDQIDKVFLAASKQKAWDHFTKPQRKNIETWHKQLQELKVQQQAEYFENRDEAEMEMSDGEDVPETIAGKRKRSKVEMISTTHSTESMMTMASDWIAASQIRDENDVLKCQLEAYKNEVSLLKQEAQNADDSKDKQIKQLQMALQGMQQQLINHSQRRKKSNSESRQVESQSPSTSGDSPVIHVLDDGAALDAQIEETGVVAAAAQSPAILPPVTSSTAQNSSQATSQESSETVLTNIKEARLIALVTTFLHVHPFGANIDYIWSYLHRLDVKIRSSELEDLLEKYPSVFGHEELERPAEKKWKFVGYENVL